MSYCDPYSDAEDFLQRLPRGGWWLTNGLDVPSIVRMLGAGTIITEVSKHIKDANLREHVFKVFINKIHDLPDMEDAVKQFCEAL